jgi:hypothetical protein
MNVVTPSPRQFISTPSSMVSAQTVKANLLKYKWVIAFVAIGVALFYWYEIRPIRVYRSCAAQASTDARKLLSSKAQLSKGTEQGKVYADMAEKNMYLRTDYVSFRDKCLLHYGFGVSSLEQTAETDGGTNAASAKEVNQK